MGHFITIEGMEGVGKSTVVDFLCKKISELGAKTIKTREPGGSPVAQRIRAVFNDPAEGEKILPVTELFLVSAARAQHVGHVIRPALSSKQWVICDRFADSTRVYQGEFGGVNREFMERVISESTGGLEPDLTILLDCEPEIARQRVAKAKQESGNRGGADRYDAASVETYRKLRDAYLDVAKRFSNRFVTVDSTCSPDVVSMDSWYKTKGRLSL